MQDGVPFLPSCAGWGGNPELRVFHTKNKALAGAGPARVSSREQLGICVASSCTCTMTLGKA